MATLKKTVLFDTSGASPGAPGARRGRLRTRVSVEVGADGALPRRALDIGRLPRGHAGPVVLPLRQYLAGRRRLEAVAQDQAEDQQEQVPGCIAGRRRLGGGVGLGA